jgi:hypothetical protein
MKKKRRGPDVSRTRLLWLCRQWEKEARYQREDCETVDSKLMKQKRRHIARAYEDCAESLRELIGPNKCTRDIAAKKGGAG